MRAKHIIPLAMISAMSAVSCAGSKNYYGSYSFQMGRDKGVHINTTMVLTKDNPDSPVEDLPNAKLFTLTAEIQTNVEKEDTPEDTPEESEESDSGMLGGFDPTEILEMIYEAFGDGTSVRGYYDVGGVFEKERRHLTLGFRVSDSFKDMVQEEIEELTPEGETPPEVTIPDIDPDFTETLLFSTVDKKGVYLTIPVSMSDLVFQVYWYGYDIYMDGGLLYFDELPEEKHHTHGTHPTSDDVQAINDDPTYTAHHKDSTLELFGMKTYPYRDYHSLTISLLKN